ncbi:MAG TPA: DUF2934 domain-containing protein [Burkholderiales bacterium]|nr:DUF2934 domain-containing protein [Burkholderiales bacterium]
MSDELRRGGDNRPRRDESSSTVTSRLRKASANQAVPIDPNLVAHRAYDRYQRRGGEHGRNLQDWLEAERELIAAQFEET